MNYTKSENQVNENIYDLILAYERADISREAVIQALGYVYNKHKNLLALDALDEILRTVA